MMTIRGTYQKPRETQWQEISDDKVLVIVYPNEIISLGLS
jgi:hypothetical protein